MLKERALSISALVARGLEFHQRGNLASAEQQYSAVLQRAPHHADALHLLGVLKGQQGKHQAGIDLMQRAIARSPRTSTYHNNLGNLWLQSGDRRRAEMSYRQALRLHPRDADACLNLGKLLCESGAIEEARRCLKTAERLAPASFETHMSVGRIEERAGDMDAALRSYLQAARLDPQSAAAALMISNVLLALKKDGEAEDACRLALQLDPRFADAHFNLGNLLRARGQLAEAATHYRLAIDLAPSNAWDAYTNLGRTLSDLGNESEALAVLLQGAEYAIDSYETWLTLGRQAARAKNVQSAELCLAKAVALDPERADAHIELGDLHLAQGRRQEASACYERAMVIAPDSSDAYTHLGKTLSELNFHEDAILAHRNAVERQPSSQEAQYQLGRELSLWGDEEAGLQILQHVVERNPRHAEAVLQIGVVMQNRGRLVEAAEWYRRSIALDGASLTAWSNLGLALAQLGDTDGLELLERAVQQRPSDPERHFMWGEKLLLHGRLEEGWREYEWRIRVPKYAHDHRSFQEPRWLGEPLEGRTILLYSEQGQGDTLQFSRYATLLAQSGAKVVLQVQGSLQRLLAGLPGVTECVAVGGETPQFDVYAPLMSLPFLLGSGAEMIPLPVLPAAALSHGKRRQGRLRVGLAWAGNAKDKRDRLRSTRLREWARLAEVEGVDFVSLQTGEAGLQGQEFESPFRFVDDCAGVRDFAHTAEIIAGLDLVISVDTAVAHLAGMLGKPVWILLYSVYDWRWGLQGSQTAWYPSATLFRQTSAGEWTAVFAEVATRLRELERREALSTQAVAVLPLV